MCLTETTRNGPHRHVHAEEHAGDDKVDVDRRAFLRGGAVTAAGAAFTVLGPAAPAVAGGGHGRKRDRGVIDLTHRFTTDFPTFTNLPATRQPLETYEEDGYYTQFWTFGEHTGTHMDAPGHFAPGQPLVDELDPDSLVGPLVVIDISRKAQRNPNATVTVDDLRRYERWHGRIPRHSLVCMDSGWAAKVDDPLTFKGGATYPNYNFPGFGIEAAMWLAERRDVIGIGVDTISLDPGNSETFPVHVEYLATGRYGIEGVANLGAAKHRRALAVVGVVPWQDGSGGPCRLIAL